MTLVTALPTEPNLARLTPKQRRTLARLDRLPKWLYSDDRYFARVDRYDREAQRRYFATMSRVTTYTGPDYRVKFQGQRSWIRANKMQYEQALAFGMQRSIGVPEIEVTAA